MPELNHKFHAGRMNKDLDERLVRNGEYKDALNVEVGTSEGSNVGAMQNLMGNINISNFIEGNFFCVGSIVNEKEDKIYWLISGSGVDIIAEYTHKTQSVKPVVVDVFPIGTSPANDSGRALNFDKTLLITGINIIDDLLFWTDNHTEPKKVNIPRAKLGSIDFSTQTQLYVRNVSVNMVVPDKYINSGKPIKHEHLTVIKKSPSSAPVLEMQSTTRGDENENGVAGEVTTTISMPGNPLQDPLTGDFRDPLVLYELGGPGIAWSATNFPIFDTPVDFKAGDVIILSTSSGNTTYDVRVKIINYYPPNVWAIFNTVFNIRGFFLCQVLSGNPALVNEFGIFDVRLEQAEPLFQFKFPRFASRYKYEDGEYSAFSPFTQVAFLPGDFDYLPKEGYNLGMVNNIRFLGIKDFVDERSIPDDVISIDILYKESDSPSVYTVKTIKRTNPDPLGVIHDEWNAKSKDERNSSTFIRTKGFLEITSEMIHAILPSNQLLRPYDNVPRKALAQEITGNRIVYGNYLQNYNLSNSEQSFTTALTSDGGIYGVTFPPEDEIKVNLQTVLKTEPVGNVIAAEYNPKYAFKASTSSYGPARAIKTLRTYQLGVVYIDELGRETPVFSDSVNNRNSIYTHKDTANLASKLAVQNQHTVPEWAESFKFFVKETSSEYYNLAMDRWYNAEDGNIWLTFPSSERNKVDLETFLILKKEHDADTFVSETGRYKILAIENEAPLFVKTELKQVGSLFDDGAVVGNLIGTNLTDFPLPGNNLISLDTQAFHDLGWASEGTVPLAVGTAGLFYLQNYEEFQIRFVSSEGFSGWYDIQNVGHDGAKYQIYFAETFGQDVSITSPISNPANIVTDVYQDVEVQLAKKIIVDRPEYDGRFFAKIKKDLTIIDSIVKPSSLGTGLYYVTSQVVSQYIDFSRQGLDYNNNVNPAYDWDWYGRNPLQGEGYKISTAEGSGLVEAGRMSIGPGGEGVHYWKKASRGDPDPSPATKSSSSGWFIDKIEGFRPFESDYKYFNKGERDWAAIFTILHENLNLNSTYSFEYNSITSHGATPQDYADWMSGSIDDNKAPLVEGTNTEGSGSLNSYLGIGGVRNPGYALLVDHLENGVNAEIGYINETTFEAPQVEGSSSGTIPSLGIEGNLIHLSHSGIGIPHEDPQLWPWDGSWNIWHEASTWANSYTDDLVFINEISTPGTIWRWKEDPGQCVYQTLAYNPNDPILIPLTASNPGWTDRPSINTGSDREITGTLWSKNSREGMIDMAGKGDLGVALYNTVEISDYYRRVMSLDNAGTSSENWDYFGIPGAHGFHNATAIPDSNLVTPAFLSGWHPYGVLAVNLGALSWMSAVPMQESRTSDMKTCGAWSKHMLGHYSGSMGDLHYWSDSTTHFASSGIWPKKTHRWSFGYNKRRRYQIYAKSLAVNVAGNRYDLGQAPAAYDDVTIHGYLPTNDPYLAPHFLDDYTALTPTTTPSKPPTIAPGVRPDGMHSGYPLPGGTSITDVIPQYRTRNSAGAIDPNAVGSFTWQILSTFSPIDSDGHLQSKNPAIWETEPKETTDLDIYHEVGQIYPTKLKNKNIEQFVGPIGEDLIENSKIIIWNPSTGYKLINVGGTTDIRVHSYVPGNAAVASRVCITLANVDGGLVMISDLTAAGMDPFSTPYDRIMFIRSDGSLTETNILGVHDIFPGAPAILCLDRQVHNFQVTLPWYNCYSFGNGVESDRIRDDYNQVTIDNGPKASTTIDEPYLEERRASGLIYSGIYNSTSGINNLNQFIAAEKITKDLNPIYGSIQKLHSRNTNLLTLCEDKVFKILANKDALYNADGSINLVSNENVLGDSVPLLGEYGISKNPESFASESYRNYFTDKSRGAVIRLSQDGLTPISDIGMRDYFGDSLKTVNRLHGSVDDKKQEYNISLDYKDYNKYKARLIGSNKPPWATDPLTATIVVSIDHIDDFQVGDLIKGAGLDVGSIIVSITTVTDPVQGTNLHILLSRKAVLMLPTQWSTYINPTITWDTVITVTRPTSLENTTISFSEITKGWTSFKSWVQEDGVSLNSEFYTFKKGNLWRHHFDGVDRNNFYGEQYDSSVELLFNELPGSVKSFQTLNYEGSQSKITPPIDPNTGNVVDGEYWDNELKEGWYVSQIFTDMQQADNHEFKEKEGKWFSQIQGVATEWLDDLTAGNIDTNEFSYQGIDESESITVISGDYSSWNCEEVLNINCDGGNTIYIDNYGPFVAGTILISVPNQWIFLMVAWFIDNAPTAQFSEYSFKICGPSGCQALGLTHVNGISGASTTGNEVLTNLYNSGFLTAEIGASSSVITSGMGSYYAAWGQSNFCDMGTIVTGSFACVEVNDENGTYLDKSSCLNAVNTPCSKPTETFNCISGGCIDPGDGTGNYTDIITCVLDCEPCQDPVVSVITQNAFFTPPNTTCSNNGSVEISVDSLGATWGYLITNSITGIDVYSDNGFASLASTTYSLLMEGKYDLTITDILGCTITTTFQILCIGIDDNCAVGPYDTVLGPATSPHNIQIAFNPATNAACDDGSLQIAVGVIGAGASSIDKIELFDSLPTSINIDNTSYGTMSTTTPVVNLSLGIYMIEVTDDLGCVYYYELRMGCNGPTASCSGAAHIMVNGNPIQQWTCYDPLDGTGDYTTLTAFTNGFLDSNGDGDPFLECIAANCVDCPIDQPFNTSPTTIINVTCGAGQGSITVELGNQPVNSNYVPSPTTWTIEYFDATNVLLITDPNLPVVSGAQATTQSFNDGSYYYVITDSNGCSWSHWFSIQCIALPSWDCDGQGNCSDPGTGLGLHSTLSACQNGCSDPTSVPCEDITAIGTGLWMSAPGLNTGAVLKWRMEVGAAIGAVELTMAPYFCNMSPKRLTWKYDGMNSDEFSFSGTTGWKKGFYGTTTAAQCTPAITNSNGSSGVSYSVPEYNYDHSLNTSFPNSASPASMVASGNNITIGPISGSEVALNSGSWGYGGVGSAEVGKMVIPKPNASPSFIDFELEIPCDVPAPTYAGAQQDQVFVFTTCPEPLIGFDSTGINGNCGAYDRKIYVAPVYAPLFPVMTAGVGNWVFWDENAVNKVADGTYYVANTDTGLPPNNKITVQNSVVTSKQSC